MACQTLLFLKRMRRHLSWSESALLMDSVIEMNVTAKGGELGECLAP